MEGLKKYGRYYELNIDDIFNLKIDLNVTNRNEYLLMNLFSTGGTINPLSSSLVYSNRSTQSNVDFGNKIKLKDYKKIVSATSNYITVINADDSIDSYDYDATMGKYKNREYQVVATAETDAYSTITNVAFLSKDEVETDLAIGKCYPTLICKGEKTTTYTLASNKISRISNNINDVIEFTLSTTSKTINWKKNNYVNRKAVLTYDSSENLTGIIIYNVHNEILYNYSLSLTTNLLEIINNITNERVKVTIDTNTTTITSGYGSNYVKSQTNVITYSNVHTIIRDTNTDYQTYYVYDASNRITNVINEAKEVEYSNYASYKLMEKSVPLTLNETSSKSILTNGFFSTNTSAWTSKNGTCTLVTNSTKSSFLYSNLVKIPLSTSFYQDVEAYGTSLDSMTLVFLYANRDGTSYFDLEVSVSLTPTLEGGTYTTKTVRFTQDTNGTTGYKIGVISLKAQESFKKARVKFYSYGVSAYIGGVQLLKRDAITYFAYDNDDKLYAVKSNEKESRINKNSKGQLINSNIGDTCIDILHEENKDISIGDYGVKTIITKDNYEREIKKEITRLNKKIVTETEYDGDEIDNETNQGFTSSYTYTEKEKLPLTQVDEEGKTTSYEYFLDSLLKKISKENKSINYTYTSKDELKTFGNYENVYDDYGNLISVKLNGNQVEGYEYNDNFSLKRKNHLGSTIDYTYDKNKIKKVNVNNQKEYTFSYDDNQRLIKAEDEENTTTFDYDVNGNVIKESTNSSYNENHLDSNGNLLSNVTNINNAYHLKSYDLENKKMGKSYSQFKNMMYRYPSVLLKDDEEITSYDTYCCFFDREDLALVNIKPNAGKEETINEILPSDQIEITRSDNDYNKVNIDGRNSPLLIYPCPVFSRNNKNDFSIMFHFKKYSNFDEGTVMYLGPSTTGELGLRVKLVTKTDGCYIGLYATKNSIDQLIRPELEFKIEDESWNEIGIDFHQYDLDEVNTQLEIFFMVNGEVSNASRHGITTLELFEDGCHLCFGGSKINDVISNPLFMDLSSIIFTVNSACKSNFNSSELVSIKELKDKYHKYDCAIYKGGYYQTGVEERRLSSSDYSTYDFFPLNGTFNSLKGTKPYILNPTNKSKNDPLLFFTFNNEIMEYAYECNGDYLEYKLPYTTSGVISFETLLSTEVFQKTLMSINFNDINLEYRINNGTLLIIKLISSNNEEGYERSVISSMDFEGGRSRLTLSWQYQGGNKFGFVLYINDNSVSFNLTSIIPSNVYLLLGRDKDNTRPYNGLIFNLITGNSYVGNSVSSLTSLSQKIRKNRLFDEYGRPINEKIISLNDETVVERDISYKNNGLQTTYQVYDEKFTLKNGNEDTFTYSYTNPQTNKESQLLRSVSCNGTTTTYQYDDYNRLVGESTNGNTSLYSYDENNNLIINNGKSLVFDSSCPFKLIKAGTFDSNGNQLTGHEYTYIGRNISSIRIVETNISLQFAYDYKGRRIQKNDIQYIYFNDKLESEIHTSYTLKFMYDENNDLYGFYYNDIPYFYLKNALGTIYAVIDQNGNKVVQYTYNAWGKIESISSTNSIIANINPFIYKSYYYDKETGLYWLSSRYYDPSIGRFITPDSIDYLDPESINGLNLYCYCYNNPIMYADPDGHMPKWAQWVVGGLAVAGLVVATVLTCGVAGAGAAAIGAAMLTGGLVSAGINVVDQLSDGGEFNWTELAISTLSGTAYGLVVGLTGGAGGWAVAGKFAVASGTSLLNRWNENATFGETMKSLGISLLVSGVAQGAGYLAGKFGPQLLSKIAPRNPNHWITMGDIGSALWAIPAVKTGVIRFVGGVAGSIINNY
ncbi:MAG: RHS repeat-associated core domain-containing protein [Bacillales bacterium]|nr:RHS repeat-associated core domain-containing protein [Bacillales bacterium]